MLNKELRKKLYKNSAIALAVLTMASSTMPAFAAEGDTEDFESSVQVEQQVESVEREEAPAVEEASVAEEAPAEEEMVAELQSEKETAPEAVKETKKDSKKETTTTTKKDSKKDTKTTTKKDSKKETTTTKKDSKKDTTTTKKDSKKETTTTTKKDSKKETTKKDSKKDTKTTTKKDSKKDTKKESKKEDAKEEKKVDVTVEEPVVDETEKTTDEKEIPVVEEKENTEVEEKDTTEATEKENTEAAEKDTTEATEKENTKETKNYAVEEVDNTEEGEPEIGKEEEDNSLVTKVMTTTVQEVFSTFGVDNVEVGNPDSMNQALLQIMKGKMCESIKKIPFAGDFLSNIFNKITSSQDQAAAQPDPVVEELKKLQESIDKLGKDLINHDDKNQLENQIKALNALIATNKVDNDTADRYLDSTLAQLEKQQSMSEFQRGTFANIYSIGAKKTVLDDTSNDYVVKPECNSKYYNDFIALTNGLTNISFLKGLEDKSGNVISLQTKAYTYNYDFNTQTFEARQKNIDNTKNLYYGRYNHLLTAMEYAKQNQYTQYTIQKNLAERYDELLKNNKYSKKVTKELNAEKEKALAAANKAETLMNAVDGHIKDIKTCKDKFDNMIKAEQEKLDQETGTEVAHCYRNDVDYKRTVNTYNTKDFLDAEKLLKVRKETPSLLFTDNVIAAKYASDSMNEKVNNTIQYTEKEDANLDYLVGLAKKKGMDFDEYIDSAFKVQGVVDSMKKADGIYKKGYLLCDMKEDTIKKTTTFVNKNGTTLSAACSVKFEKDEGFFDTVKGWGRSIWNVLSGNTNDKENNKNLKIGKVTQNNKIVGTIERAK